MHVTHNNTLYMKGHNDNNQELAQNCALDRRPSCTSRRNNYLRMLRSKNKKQGNQGTAKKL